MSAVWPDEFLSLRKDIDLAEEILRESLRDTDDDDDIDVFTFADDDPESSLTQTERLRDFCNQGDPESGRPDEVQHEIPSRRKPCYVAWLDERPKPKPLAPRNLCQRVSKPTFRHRYQRKAQGVKSDSNVIHELSHGARTASNRKAGPPSKSRKSRLRKGNPLQENRNVGESQSKTHEAVKAIGRLEIFSSINGVSVSALADTGSSLDVISKEFAEQHSIQFDQTRTCSVALPTGTMTTEGIALVDFKFDGEERSRRREFHVLKSCFYSVILGKPFLDLTETLTKFTKRIHQAFVPCLKRGSSLFLLGRPHQSLVTCQVNGRSGEALADTGSDFMFVSGDFARQNNFKVHTEKKYRKLIRFVDGSQGYTDGIVRNVKLEVDLPKLPYGCELKYSDYIESVASHLPLSHRDRHSKYIYDLHVLEGLCCDMILSNQFVHDHSILLRHTLNNENQGHVRETDHLAEVNWQQPGLCVIREVQQGFFARRRQKHRKRPGGDCELGSVNALGPRKPSEEEEQEEERRDREDERLKGLPESEQSEARNQECRRRDQWVRDRMIVASLEPALSICAILPGSATSSSRNHADTSPEPQAAPFPGTTPELVDGNTSSSAVVSSSMLDMSCESVQPRSSTLAPRVFAGVRTPTLVPPLTALDLGAPELVTQDAYGRDSSMLEPCPHRDATLQRYLHGLPVRSQRLP